MNPFILQASDCSPDRATSEKPNLPFIALNRGRRAFLSTESWSQPNQYDRNLDAPSQSTRSWHGLFAGYAQAGDSNPSKAVARIEFTGLQSVVVRQS